MTDIDDSIGAIERLSAYRVGEDTEGFAIDLERAMSDIIALMKAKGASKEDFLEGAALIWDYIHIRMVKLS